jgi:cbb3-type cytochrome oxidase maturation protein
MSIIYILIPIAILLTALGVYLFFWAVKTEQFEDLEKQGMSILFDDDAKADKGLADKGQADKQQPIESPVTTQESTEDTLKQYDKK